MAKYYFNYPFSKIKTGMPKHAGFWWRRWIRTIEAKTQQIYSLPPLATRELSHIQL